MKAKYETYPIFFSENFDLEISGIRQKFLPILAKFRCTELVVNVDINLPQDHSCLSISNLISYSGTLMGALIFKILSVR